MKSVIVILLNDEGISKKVYMNMSEAIEAVTNEVAYEIYTHPGYDKWMNKNRIAVINYETRKMLSMRVIEDYAEYLLKDGRGEYIEEERKMFGR